MEGVLVGLGTVLAERYTLEREVGRGGMATVYLARDARHNRVVAAKILRPEIAAWLGHERFLREIQIAAGLTHPHILPLYDSGEAGGLLYYVMPYVDGESLLNRIQRDGRLPHEDARRIAREVADALSYAHAHNIVHRDIKPGNILLEAGHAVVADFGIARAVSQAGGEDLTTTGLVVGTPMYMSPEQISGSQIDGRSDVYSLGCVLYEMVLGEPPFKGPSPHVIASRQLYEDLPSLAAAGTTVPPDIQATIEKALAKSPADRFSSAADFAEALAVTGTVVASRPHPARLRRAWTYGVVALVVASALFFLGRYVPGLQTPAQPAWIVVADFEGPQDDRGLPDAVRELVTTELDQSNQVSPLPRQQLTSAMRDAGLPDTTRVTAALAQELAVRSSVRTILAGSVRVLAGGQYAIVLRVTDADNDRTVVSAATQATAHDLVSRVQELGRQIRRGLGERRIELQSNKPLVQVATPSFAAYRKYSEAVGLAERGELTASTRLLHEAIAQDTGFASAWATIASNYFTMRNLDSARFAVGEALRRPHRLSDAERYRLEADAAYALNYDLNAAVGWFDLLLQTSPHSLSGHNNRGVLLYSLGRYDEALAEFKRTEALEPVGFGDAQIELFNQVVTLLALGREKDAGTTARRLTGVFADYAAPLLATYEDRWATAESLSAGLAAAPSTPAWVKVPAITMLAGALATRGAVADAERRLRSGAASSDEASRRWFVQATLLLAASSGRALGRLPAWLATDSTSGGQVAAGIWAAMTGDTTGARAKLSALETRPVVELRRQRYGIQLLRAHIHAAGGRWSEVINTLGPAASRGERDGGSLDQVSSMALRWLVATSYDHLSRADSAAAYFRMVIEPRATPFSHLALRGLTWPFVKQRLAALANNSPEVGRIAITEKEAQ